MRDRYIQRPGCRARFEHSRKPIKSSGRLGIIKTYEAAAMSLQLRSQPYTNEPGNEANVR